MLAENLVDMTCSSKTVDVDSKVKQDGSMEELKSADTTGATILDILNFVNCFLYILSI